MFQKTLLAVDSSDNALRAARLVAQMVTKLPAQVTILSAVGSRGLSKREVNRLGSISQEVANQAPCSVLLVR